MKKLSVLFILIIILSLSLMAEEIYSVNVEKSSVGWEATKVTGGHSGTIEVSSGELIFDGVVLIGGEFIIDMTTIENLDLDPGKWHDKLISHLKSDDFFAVEKYPKAKLVITGVKKESGNSYIINSEVTIKDITKPVEFDTKIDMKDGNGKAEAEITLDRSQWDIKYKSGSFFENLGDKLIYDEFKLKVKLIFTKK